MNDPYCSPLPDPPMSLVVYEVRRVLLSAWRDNPNRCALTAEDIEKRIVLMRAKDGEQTTRFPTVDEVRAGMVILVETNLSYEWYSPARGVTGSAGVYGDDRPRVRKAGSRR